MAVIEELIRKEENGTISFGNYQLDKKTKLSDFEVAGAMYKVKTFKEITKLERNEKMLMEVVPGATVHNLDLLPNGANFQLEGVGDVQFTMELEPSEEYKIFVDDVNVGKVKTNMSGKITVNVELANVSPVVKIEKV
ncbi:MAG: endosialidase [Bacillota bacterium]